MHYNLLGTIRISAQIQMFTRLETNTGMIHNGQWCVTSRYIVGVKRTKTRYRNLTKNRFVYSNCAEKQNTRCFSRFLSLQCKLEMFILQKITKSYQILPISRPKVVKFTTMTVLHFDCQYILIL
jgi:hypothetical protein